jgi:hypothetical protein
MEPSAAISSIETALRVAIRTIFGQRWLDSPGAPDVTVLRERQAVEHARRDGAIVSTDLLDYAMTTDLFNVVRRNWDVFKPIFDDKKRFDAHMGTVLDVRNTIAHSRPLVPFEKDLVSGIAGLIRNQVARHEGTMDESAPYYPTIESAIDHQGYESHFQPSYGSGPLLSRLNIGQEMVFTCSAFKIDDRDLEWQLLVFKGYFMQPVWLPNGQREGRGSVPQVPVVGGAGELATLSYVLDRNDVHERLSFVILLRAASDFHRHDEEGFDDARSFTYALNPPRGG